MSKPEILVIDDEPQIRKLLEIILDSHDYIPRSASGGKEGMIMAAHHPPDLILLDLGLPDKNGHEVLAELRTWYQRPVIILSILQDEDNIVKALDEGATDYLTKPFRTGELLARIRSCLRRHPGPPGSSVMRFGALEADLAKRVIRRGDDILKLTPTEFNLLSLMMRNEGRVLTHHFLLREIWGMAFQTETQYLRVFIGQLRKKIEEDPDHPQHIITESGVGYRFC